MTADARRSVTIPSDMAQDLRSWAEALSLIEGWREDSRGNAVLRDYKSLLDDVAALDAAPVRPSAESLAEWANRSLREDIPLDVLAACIYPDAGDDEAMTTIDRLADAGWLIVPTPRMPDGAHRTTHSDGRSLADPSDIGRSETA